MNLKDSHFAYTATVKNEQDVKFEALQLFPGLSEISFSSRSFTNYAECVKSCKSLLEDVMHDINITTLRFKLGAEVNPKHSGTQTLSKDWGDVEIARFWVYDKAMEGNGVSIAAVCRGSIYALPKVHQVTN